jgi:GT2 family glycosyltransferase
LRAAHALLCSPFVTEPEYRAALGGGRGDLGTVGRYLAIPAPRRPTVSIYFDSAWYRATNPHLGEARDALLHFLEPGVGLWRPPHPLIDPRHIALQDPALLGAAPTAAALARVLEEDLADPSPYFDRAHYRAALAAAGSAVPERGLLAHFLRHGLAAGARPNAWLDPVWYAARHDDVPPDPYGALRDFVVRGDPTGRPAGPEFDGALYWRRYSDVAEGGVPPLRHWLAHGRREGRQVPNDRPIPPRPPTHATIHDAGHAPAHDATGAPAPARVGARIGAPLEVDRAAAGRARAAFDAAGEAARQARKEAVRARPPPLLVCPDPAAMLGRIVPPVAAAPRLSILIPAFNEPALTVACLVALCEAPPATACEIVLADDASTDPVARRLADIAGLVVVRQPANVGFLRNCNAAFAACRGEYVLLLNNDAQPLPGAIDRLVAALDADPGVAAAGPKMLYPDGRLQEAGCGLTPDGRSIMVGLFLDPDAPEFCHDRDVAYCSGACLLVRRALVGPTLFDEAYQPAYCEDADLCLRLRAGGHRIRYVAGAVIVHRLAASADPTRQARRLRGIARNQARLQERWGEPLAAANRVRPIAFYLPQFHPTPRNDRWWGKGFTEWTNVARAEPSFAGHYQPHLPADLGFYDLRLADTLRAQAALAARYGLAGFCVYHYDFGDTRMLDTPMRVLAGHPDIAFPHCLCWANENWTRHWDGGEREILVEQRYDDATLARIVADVARHAADPRYLRVEGRPLFLVYRPLLLPDAAAFARRCRDGFARAGLPGPHLVYVESMEAVDRGLSPAAIGFDASVEFPPHGRAVPCETPADIVKEGWSGYRYDYARTAAAFIERPGVPYRRYPAVFPSWDNTPRQPLLGTSFEGATPELFAGYVEAKIDEIRALLTGDARLLFVNAWNEWAEGAHLEPDCGFGHRWLEALRDAMEARAWA